MIAFTVVLIRDWEHLDRKQRRKGSGKEKHFSKTDHVSGEVPSDGLAARDGEVGNEEDDVGHDVDDESVLVDGHAALVAVLVGAIPGAVEVLDGRREAEDGDERGRDGQLKVNTKVWSNAGNMGDLRQR